MNNEVSPQATPREEILSEAAGLITGDRNKTYGSPTQNFQDTADVWNVLLRHKLRDGEKITAGEVAMFMAALKLVRMVAQPKKDNWLDLAGYAACGFEVDVETGRIDGPEPSVEAPLWFGRNTDPEPPARVVRLRPFPNTKGKMHLYRVADGTWTWNTEILDSTESARYRSYVTDGFSWGSVPGQYLYDEVREA